MRSANFAITALACLMSSAAWGAADKPIMGPAPDWVKPVALPPAPVKDDEAPIKVMLSDQQSRLEPGRVSTYVDFALKIQTPQGLAAGNLSLPWNPETDTLSVHKLLIHRDGTVIDVLAGGQTFTVVRREPNLESATLDGVLTANIQPEGLQVGDILEYAATVTSSDPVLKGHVEQAGGGWNALPFARAHLSVQWPSNIPVTLRQTGGLPPLKIVKNGTMSGVELSLDNVEPVIPPRLAPQRYLMGRLVEFSDFKSWADLGALMAPLYVEAAKIPAEGPLRVELEKIRAASTDPVKRTEAALTLVQDRVRYVALLMGVGGLTPARAEETWARRYGDCKAKTALLLALLHELGIEAEPVAANALSGDGLDQRLPMVGLFNHVLVRAHVGGQAYWLDGTRSGDTSLARLRTPDFGWGLPLVARNAALVQMRPAPLDEPEDEFVIDIDARAGLSIPAPVKAHVTLRGDEATGTRLALAGMAADARDNALRQFFKGRLDDIEISKVSASFDPATGSELLAMEGKAKMDWSDAQYWTDWTRVGYEADFSRTGSNQADAPFAVGYPMFNRTVETIQLPPGFTGQNIFRPDPINETVGGVEYRRNSSLTDNVFRIERTVRATEPEFAAKDAPAIQKRLKELNDLPVSVRRPGNYQMTVAEVEEELKATPTTAAGFVRRGGLLLGLKRYEEAHVAYEAALKLEPGDQPAILGRSQTYAAQGNFAAANKGVEAVDIATATDAPLVLTRGFIAMQAGDFKTAIAAFSRAIVLQPNDRRAIAARAEAYRQSGDIEAALADMAAAIKLDPKDADAYLARANLLRSVGRKEEALQEAKAVVTANPENGFAHSRKSVGTTEVVTKTETAAVKATSATPKEA